MVVAMVVRVVNGFVACVLCVALTGCALSSDEAPTSVSASPPSSSDSLTPPHSIEPSLEEPVGESAQVVLEVSPALKMLDSSVSVEGDVVDGALFMTDKPHINIEIHGEDLSVVTALDSTVAVLEQGEFVVGVSAPREAKSRVPVRQIMSEVGEDKSVVRVLVSRPATSQDDEPVQAVIGYQPVSATSWGNREGGVSLAVTPSVWGRNGGLTVVDFGWEQLT
ncbi:hypothetical protein [Timonella sp. A28]|uniref:hypothetical protein n=1 Tax=Timonella sp. A28 TaxID=3442640 RepID=UPI003EB8812F